MKPRSFSAKEIILLLTAAKELGIQSFDLEGVGKFQFSRSVNIHTLASKNLEHREHQEPLRGEPGWHEWRKKGIGGSDAPAVMNTSPWANPRIIWELKTGRRQPDAPNFPMRRGLRLEPVARARYEDITGIEMPAAAEIRKDFSFLRANADGLNRQVEKGLEIKCPGKVDHGKALEGEIPEKYIFQMVHLELVFKMPFDYMSFNPEFPLEEQSVIIPFRRQKSLEGKLLSEEMKFWECVTKDIPPDSDKPKDPKKWDFPTRKNRY